MTEPPTTPEAPEHGTFRADLLHQKAARLNRLTRILIAAGVAVALVLAAGAAHAWRYFLGDLPEIPATERLATLNRAPGMTFLDRNGRLLATRGPKYGLKTSLSDLPPHVSRAFLAAEDRRFDQHGAVDWRAVVRALRANAAAGRTVEGASTLTQQLTRDLFLDRDRSLKRKVQEVLLAERLYDRLGSRGVLELYLNRVYLGAGAYGIDAAARTYFGKPARALTLAEAALLAGLPQSPARLDPTRNLEGARRRGRLVLNRMAAEGWVTPAQAAVAARQRITIQPRRSEGDLAWAIDLAAEQARARAPGRTDLVVRLSLDPALQAAAARALRETLDGEGRRLGAQQGAVVLLAADGGIRGLVGGRDWSQTQFNRAVQARRQPGSAFKPFVWAAALEAGVAADGRVSTDRIAFAPYSPDDPARGGDLDLEEALVRSSNAAAVRLARDAGTERVAEVARRFGVEMTPPRRPGLSIALGAYETTLLSLTAAYQPFQQGGRRQLPWLVDEVSGSDGRTIWRREPTPPLAVYDAAKAGALLRMMTGVVERGTGKRAAFGRPAAGKTGTSQHNKDAWFIGFTPDWLAGVWIGNDDGSPTRGVEGGTLPADVWRKLMIAAHQGLPARDFAGQTVGLRRAADVTPPPETDVGAEEALPEDREAFYRMLEADLAQAGG